MSDLKKAWVKTAKSLVLAANDLGNAVIDSVKVGKDKVLEWANTDDATIETEAQVTADEPAEESPKTAE